MENFQKGPTTVVDMSLFTTHTLGLRCDYWMNETRLQNLDDRDRTSADGERKLNDPADFVVNLQT